MEPLGRLVSRARSVAVDRYERWLEARMERRLGIDTAGIDHDLAGLGVPQAGLAHAHAYQPVQVRVFARIMRAARIEPARHVMIDFGSGKGRALILGAEFGFKRLIGVELAPALHAAAMRNVQAYRQRRPDAPPIELHCGDAAGWPIPEERLLIFLYNPFAEPVVARIARRLEISLRRQPRDVVVAYRNPVYSRVFDALTCLERVTVNRTFALYRLTSSTRPGFAAGRPGLRWW
jgi:SAM-dependent methyltransferase